MPIADSVNIPLEGLTARAYELPPKDETIQIAGPEEIARKAQELLIQIGRNAEIVSDWIYASPQLYGRLWEPNAFLAETLPKVKVGKALDLACGTGRDAVYMAGLGWNVVGIDWLPDAIDKAKQLAARHGVERTEFQVQDLEKWNSEIETFDLIFCAFFLHRPLCARLVDWLKPDGSIVYETFTTVHRNQFGKPNSDAHVLKPEELPALFSGWEIVHHDEGWHACRHTARLWVIRR